MYSRTGSGKSYAMKHNRTTGWGIKSSNGELLALFRGGSAGYRVRMQQYGAGNEF